MEIALIAKNKLDFVLGTTARSEAEPLQNQWNRYDKMVISCILHAVEKKTSDSILFSNSSRQIWLDLEQRFGQSDEQSFSKSRKICILSPKVIMILQHTLLRLKGFGMSMTP